LVNVVCCTVQLRYCLSEQSANVGIVTSLFTFPSYLRNVSTAVIRSKASVSAYMTIAVGLVNSYPQLDEK
ncbi:hypothetical protein, partial [Paenibacillus sp. E194]|uniref:hypothetical protein n=1 Tax=Paenibacillus sp. E194 TaxID=1458845 RepID=UPI0005C9CF32